MVNAIINDNNQYITLEDVSKLIDISISTTRSYLDGYRFVKFMTKLKIGNPPRYRRVYIYNKDFLNNLQDFYVAINGYECKKIKEALKEV